MIRVFKSSVIRQILSDDELSALVEDFKSYKQSGKLPKLFGRDALYDHPNNLPLVLSEQVQHIHLGSEDSPFPINKIQFHRTSDIHLVYCQGDLDVNCFLLMTILSPNAHQQARSRDIMYKLGLMAQKFRQLY